MKLNLKYCFLLLATALSVNGFAQKFSVSGPDEVRVGQRFQVTWSLKERGSNFIAPEITDFQVLGGPNQSTSMQYINGSLSQNVSFSYILLASKVG
ncbi:BatD family protein, partial [Bacteroidota bacterium]